MLINMEKDKPKKIGFNYMVYETFYPCDGYKECCNSPSCGKECKYTKDINHWRSGTKPIRKLSAPMSE